MKEQFENKKYVTMFSPSDKSPLGYVDLLNFSYRVGQLRFETVPTFRSAAKGTGLKEQTISDSSTRLITHCLITGDYQVISPCRKLDWFIVLDALKAKNSDGSPFQWLQNWRSYVRAPGEDNPLTVPSVLLYSVILHSVSNGWKPSDGWSHEYLALVTGTNSRTVATSLKTLEDNGFLEVQAGCRFRLFKLIDSQLACFADKKIRSHGSVVPDEITDDISPKADVFKRNRIERERLVEYLNRWPIDNADRDRIYKAVRSLPDWPNDWQKAATALVEKLI